MDKIVVVSEYNKEAHKAFYRFHMLRKTPSTYFILAIAVMVLVLAIINTINLSNSGDVNNVIFSWVLATFTLLLTPTLVKTKIASIIKQESAEREGVVETIEINKIRIERKSPQGKVIFNWANIESIYETKDYIFIYVTGKAGMLLIKKDVKEGKIDDVEKFALKYMNKNKKGKVKYKKYFRVEENESK